MGSIFNDLEGIIGSLSWYAVKSSECFESGSTEKLDELYKDLKNDVAKYVDLMEMPYYICKLLRFKRIDHSDAYPNIPEGICLMLIPFYLTECICQEEAYKNTSYEDVIIGETYECNKILEFGCIDIGIPFDISETEGKYYD